jgi:hypothetical protein
MPCLTSRLAVPHGLDVDGLPQASHLRVVLLLKLTTLKCSRSQRLVYAGSSKCKIANI